MNGLENFPRPRGKHRRDADEEGKFRRRGPAQAQQQRQQNRGAGAGRSGKDRRNQLADGYGKDDGPGNVVAQFFPAQPPFDGEKGDAADEQRQSDGRGGFRQLETLVVEDKPNRAGDEKRGEYFQQIILRFALAPLEDKFV